jgi:hypothetical protein
MDTGVEFGTVTMSFDTLTPWELASAIAWPFHYRVNNLRSLDPICAKEGEILHLAVDADIVRTATENYDYPYTSFEAELALPRTPDLLSHR